MGELKDDFTHKHTHISPSIVNYLFERKDPKVGVAALKENIKEYWDEFNRIAKEIKLLMSMVYYIRYKVGKEECKPASPSS